MKTFTWLLAGWTTAMVGVTLHYALRPFTTPRRASRAEVQVPLEAPKHSAMSPDSMAAIAARHDAFRVTRRASDVAFQLQRDQSAPVAQSRQLPPLALAGIIVGPRPLALIDGLPGIEGTRLLGVGDRVNGVTIQSVGEREAIVVVGDTTLVLPIRGARR